MYSDPERDSSSQDRPIWSGDPAASGQRSADRSPYAPPSYAPPSSSPEAPETEPVAGTVRPYSASAAPDYPTPDFDLTSTYQTVSPPPTEPVRRRPGRLAGYGGIFAVALLAAALGSAGTYGAITLTSHSTPAPASAASQPAAAASSAAGAAEAIAGQPTAPAQSGAAGAAATQAPNTGAGVAAPAQSDVVKAAAAVRPAVVTIDVAPTGSGGLGGQGGIGGGNGSGGNGSGGNGSGGNGSGGTGGTGSGIIFDSNGWIVTNRHVVTDGGSITVTLADGRQYPGTTYGVDTLTDLAIVKINATNLPVAPLGNSKDIQIGESVIAIGDPLGEYPGSVTAGIVSGLNRGVQTTSETLDDLIQTDAAINPGNSGGALVDTTGHVIGINTAGSTAAQGIGFAVPIDLAKPLVQQALAGQKLARPWLGIRYVQLTPAIATQNKLPVTGGAWITSDQQSGPAVISGSPAEKAGLKENDIVTAVNGQAVDINHPFIERMSSYGPGQSVTLTVRRDSQTLTLTITLATRPANVQ